MAQYDDLVEALIWLLTNRIQNKIQYSHGLLGDGQGRVRVTGNEDFVYARPDRFSTRTLRVFNKRVEGQDGDPIIIGELPWEPGLTQVISIDWQTYLNVGWGEDTGFTSYHGRTHTWRDAAPGLDTFPVYRRQLGDLQAVASISGTNAVDISAYSMELYGQQKQFPGLVGFSLQGAIPTATGTARMALLYWDPSSGTTGYVGVATGTTGGDADPILLNRPISLPGTVPISFVKLTAGQQAVTEFDFYDAREPFRPGIGFGTGSSQFYAGLIPIADVGTYYTGTTVEGALQEIGNRLPLDGITVTVATSGGDFTTIQDAIDYFKNKLVTGLCVISVAAGTWTITSQLDFSELYLASTGSLTLQGDTRVLPGISYVDGTTGNRGALANGGTGSVSLSNSGTTITVTMSTTNPDFDADGWGSGDLVQIYDNAGTSAEFTISSVANNVITLTTTAPTVGNDATAILLKSDRIISRSTAGEVIRVVQSRGVQVDGFHLVSSTGAGCNGILLVNGAGVTVENTSAIVEDFAFYCQGFWGWMDCSSGAVSAWDCDRGFYADPNSVIQAQRTVANACTFGYLCQNQGVINASFGIAVNCSTVGYQASVFSDLSCGSATARQCTTGYISFDFSFVRATTTNANNNGNGADYSPAPVVPGYAQSADYAVLRAS